jgi:hypothetical protein
MGKTRNAIIDMVDWARAGHSVLLVGSPGTGKSSVCVGEFMAAMAEHLGVDVEEMSVTDLRPCTMDPIDYRGYPFPDPETKTTTWLMPDFLPKTGPGVLLIEEIGNADKSHHNALYQLVEQRKMGDTYKLPDDVFIVATSNLRTDGSGVKKLPTALKDRFAEVKFECDPDDWREWARNHGVDYKIIAATHFLEDILTEWDGACGDAQSSPRSLVYFDNVVRANGLKVGANADDGGTHGYERPVYDEESLRVLRKAEQSLGETDAARVVGFMALFEKLPPIPEILANPEEVEIPDRLDVTWALVTQIAKTVEEDDLKNALLFIDRLGLTFRAVFGVELPKLNTKLAHKTVAFTDWIARNPSLFS